MQKSTKNVSFKNDVLHENLIFAKFLSKINVERLHKFCCKRIILMQSGNFFECKNWTLIFFIKSLCLKYLVFRLKMHFINNFSCYKNLQIKKNYFWKYKKKVIKINHIILNKNRISFFKPKTWIFIF